MPRWVKDEAGPVAQARFAMARRPALLPRPRVQAPSAFPERSSRWIARMRRTAALAVILSLIALSGPARAHEVGAWAGGKAAPAERSEVAVAEIDGRAYVIGDYNGATEILIYDLAKDSWRKGAAFPYPVHHAMALGMSGKIYVFGGYMNGWNAVANVFAYDPKTDSWTPRTAMPAPQAAGGAARLGERIHVVGGSVTGR